MADKYISVAAFTDEIQERYCMNCDRRKGMKNGKLKMVYDIGDIPCRSCRVMDMLEEIEDFHAADVVEVVRCGECIYRTSGFPFCQGRPNDWFCANGYGRTASG